MSRSALALGVVSLVLLANTACTLPVEKNDASQYLKALPDERILVALPAGGRRAVGDVAQTYLTTLQVSTDVNGFIGDVLDAVGEVTAFEPTWSADEREFFWGPWSDSALDPNEMALYIAFDEASNTYGWAFAQRPRGSVGDAGWVPLIAGEAAPGATDDEGSGYFVVDFDAIASLNPAEPVAGTFVSTYEVTAAGVDAQAGFDAFTDDTSNPQRVTAGYRYGQDAAGAGYMDFAYNADVHEDGSLEETIALRTRWLADGRGRGDVVVFGGDLSPLAYTGTECWGGDFRVVYEEDNFELTMSGDEGQCAFSEPAWSEDAPEA